MIKLIQWLMMIYLLNRKYDKFIQNMSNLLSFKRDYICTINNTSQQQIQIETNDITGIITVLRLTAYNHLQCDDLL